MHYTITKKFTDGSPRNFDFQKSKDDQKIKRQNKPTPRTQANLKSGEETRISNYDRF